MFAACWFLPVDSARFLGAVHESLSLTRWLAREHVLLCLVPALSLPNMLVIRSVLGTRQTAAFVALVVLLSTVAGVIYGTLFPG